MPKRILHRNDEYVDEWQRYDCNINGVQYCAEILDGVK